MTNDKNKILTLVAIITLFIIVIAGTYAYFAPQVGGTTSTNATVTSNTTDLLTFSINRDISFTVTQNDFQENGTNQSGDATATATLTPNNKTGAATMNYYLYLNIEENPITYSEANTNGLPELMLQVFDGNNGLVTLTGLGNQQTVKGVTGYDITGVEGLQTLLDNHAISASNNTATIENWRIVITLINHDFNQNDNTGKEVSAEIIIQKDMVDTTYTGLLYRNNQEYLKNNSSIHNSTTNVYCLMDDNYNSCNYSWTYPSQSSCESNLYGNGYCEEKTINLDTGSYTDDASNIHNFVNYYLKHSIVSDYVTTSSACLYYNNQEFCLETNYWDTNASTTLTKLKDDMENNLGVQNVTCSNETDYVSCTIGGYYCSVDSLDIVSCGEDSGDYNSCHVSSDGISACTSIGYINPNEPYNVYVSIDKPNQTRFYIGTQDYDYYSLYSLNTIHEYLENNNIFVNYLKITLLDGVITDLHSCYYYNNKDLCIGLDYWDNDAETTKLKLENDLATELGITAYSYQMYSNAVRAYIDGTDSYSTYLEVSEDIILLSKGVFGCLVWREYPNNEITIHGVCDLW